MQLSVDNSLLYTHISRRFNYKNHNNKRIESLECQNSTVRYMNARVDCVTLKSNPKDSPLIVNDDASITQLSGDNFCMVPRNYHTRKDIMCLHCTDYSNET